MRVCGDSMAPSEAARDQPCGGVCNFYQSYFIVAARSARLSGFFRFLLSLPVQTRAIRGRRPSPYPAHSAPPAYPVPGMVSPAYDEDRRYPTRLACGGRTLRALGLGLAAEPCQMCVLYSLSLSLRLPVETSDQSSEVSTTLAWTLQRRCVLHYGLTHHRTQSARCGALAPARTALRMAVGGPTSRCRATTANFRAACPPSRSGLAFRRQAPPPARASHRLTSLFQKQFGRSRDEDIEGGGWRARG